MTDSVTPTAELISRIAPQHADEFWFLGGQPRLSPSRDRLAGFTCGLAQAGITLRPEWVINGNYHPSSGYEMFAALCARLGRPPKALFTAACGLLEGVLRYMSQHHLLDSIFISPASTITICMIRFPCALIPCSRIIASWPGTATICSAS